MGKPIGAGAKVDILDCDSDNDTGGYTDTHCEVNGKDTYDYGQAVDGFRCSTNSGSAKFTWEAKGYIN